MFALLLDGESSSSIFQLYKAVADVILVLPLSYDVMI